jgi:hypothetical protein
MLARIVLAQRAKVLPRGGPVKSLRGGSPHPPRKNPSRSRPDQLYLVLKKVHCVVAIIVIKTPPF